MKTEQTSFVQTTNNDEISMGENLCDEFDSLVNSIPKEAPQKKHSQSNINKDNLQPEDKKTFNTISAFELGELDLPPLYYLVKDLLPQGLALLASAPKVGKSWYALDLCLSVASGTPFLGKAVEKNEALYLALEDSFQRLQGRAMKVWRGKSLPGIINKQLPKELRFTIEAEPISIGLLEQMETYVKDYPKTKLIVIDIFEMVRGGMVKNESPYSYDTRELKLLGQFAKKHELCILIIHHERKAIDKTNPFANILGSTAMQGAVDTMLVLSKEHINDSEATLHIRGRDVEEQSLTLGFDKTTWRWHLIGNAADKEERQSFLDYNDNPIIKTIKDRLTVNTCLKITAGNLLKAVEEFVGDVIPGIDTAEGLAKKLPKIAPLMLKHDSIAYSPPAKNGGKGQRKHFFTKLKPSLASENTVTSVTSAMPSDEEIQM